MSELTHTKAIAVFLFSIIGCLLTADAVRVTAAEGEFPAEWYFDSMQGMREKLEGRPAPEISTDKWIGDETTLADCRGKVVVLDFWATWCGPCIASIPKNIDLVKQHPDDLVFIGLHSAASGWDSADKMVEDREINYPVALDTGDSVDDYSVTGFPTYVVIDAEGIVRAAGVLPTYVKKIAEKLIEESGASSGGASRLASLNREWFYEGATWMRPWQEQLGKPAAPVRSKAWWLPDGENEETSEPDEESIASDADAETPDGYSESDLEGLVRVLHFTRPGMTLTNKQLEKLNEAAKKYTPQGVVFTAICDHESDWDQTKTLAAKLQLKMPMVLDRKASADKDEAGSEGDESGDDEDDSDGDSDSEAASDTEKAENAATGSTPPDETKPEPREAGETARKYHIRIAPVTVLIDRQGRIRATGLRTEQIDAALDLLLAEQAG